jgi:hypothetical protein
MVMYANQVRFIQQKNDTSLIANFSYLKKIDWGNKNVIRQKRDPAPMAAGPPEALWCEIRKRAGRKA